MQVGAVNCDDDKTLAQKYGIQGFPTIKFFNGEGGVEDYKGARETSNLVEFGKQKAGMGGGGAGGESKAVPNVEYLQAWNFLHRNPRPSVLMFGDEKMGKHAPGWLVTLALSYKESKEEVEARGGGTVRRQKVNFGYVNAEDDRVLTRFGLSSRPTLLLLQPEEGRGGAYVSIDAAALQTKMKSEVKENVQEFVDRFAFSPLDPTDALQVPSFPEPSIPRKIKAAELTPLDPENLDFNCYDVKEKMCVIGLVGESEAAQEVLAELSRKYRHDPLAFTSVAAKEQPEFAAAFGDGDAAAAATASSLVVVKAGRRPRFASAALEDAAAAGAFLDKALGGDITFTRLKEGLPRMVEAWERAASAGGDEL